MDEQRVKEIRERAEAAKKARCAKGEVLRIIARSDLDLDDLRELNPRFEDARTAYEIACVASAKDVPDLLDALAAREAEVARVNDGLRNLLDWLDTEIADTDGPHEYLHGKHVAMKQVRRKVAALAAPPPGDGAEGGAG